MFFFLYFSDNSVDTCYVSTRARETQRKAWRSFFTEAAVPGGSCVFVSKLARGSRQVAPANGSGGAPHYNKTNKQSSGRHATRLADVIAQTAHHRLHCQLYQQRTIISATTIPFTLHYIHVTCTYISYANLTTHHWYIRHNTKTLLFIFILRIVLEYIWHIRQHSSYIMYKNNLYTSLLYIHI